MTIKSESDFRRGFDPRNKVAPREPFNRTIPKSARRFIVVGAQNATPLVQEWWDILRNMATAKQAELIVIPLRYRNPTSIWTASQRDAEWWDPAVVPYLIEVRRQLHKHLTIVADMKIPPTKSSPLSGYDAMSTTQSAIFGHPKLQMRVVPVPSGRMGKILTTTGVCTQPNYTDSGLGKISEFHHSLSAVLVELDGKRFHLRHLHYHAGSGSCIDLNTQYFADRVAAAPRAIALVQGDLHVDFQDPKVAAARANLTALIKPQYRVWHDTLDSYSCTPHHLGNPFIQLAKAQAGRGNVREEVGRALRYVQSFADAAGDEIQVIVPSNHDDMLSRWVRREDWKQMSPENADFYLELAREMRRGSQMTKRGVEYPDPFSLLLRACTDPARVIVLDRDESFEKGGIELGMHGDIGPNGARGSRQNIRRTGVKSVIGHGHSPGIDEGCYQTGTSTYLRLEYNHGASGWLNTDGIVDANGKRQLITYIDGRFMREETSK